MQLVRKLLSLPRSHAGRNQKIRGLSTAELVGIIVIVGILGALGGTYIGSLVSSANKNAISQNIQSLDTVCASMLAGGIPVLDSGGAITSVNGTAVASTTALLQAVNGGVAGANGVSYRMTPPISDAAISAGTYVPAVTDDGAGNATAITWTQAAGVNTP